MISETALARTRHAEAWPTHDVAPRGRAHEAAPRGLHQPGLPPEFAALERAGVAPGPLYAALAEAERTSAFPFDVLTTSGALGEDELIEALARGLGVDLARPADFDGSAIDADAFRLAMTSDHLWSDAPDGSPRLLIAARGRAVAKLAAARRGKPRETRIALASPRLFADIAVARAGAALAARAAQGPAAVRPELTVAGGMPRIGRGFRCAVIGGALAAVAACFAIHAVGVAALAAIGLLFATLNGFRLWLALTPASDARPKRWIADRDLPVYTVLVALYREGAVVAGLIDALDRLDYPRGKLDIKILTEAGDRETLDAIAARPPRSGVEVIVVPPGGPQTKPRALNAGLLAARGEFVTVFDAEDRPDPKQLRVAVDAFRRGRRELGCVQARLAMDNLADGWIARQFAIEYAALFDVVLPALSTLRLPIALGGTSNHFRAEALREIGGWDAGNVTEDADLGLRLARLGYATETIDSVTWEEAPTTIWPWIRQRTRWMKGYMVTAIVHGRRPADLAASLGLYGFVASQLLIGGVALTALAYPVVFAFILYAGLSGDLFAGSAGLADVILAGAGVANMIVGFAAGLACGWMGIDRRCPQRLAFDLVLLPVYWLLVGWAAWRAAFQILAGETTHWEKTTHGVSSRRATPPA